MSVGTIVTIVLLMTALIFGLILTRNIFKSATGAVDLTDQQLRNQINELFSEEKRLVIYPATESVEIRQEKIDAVGIGIKNLLEGVEGTNTFSYEVVVANADRCGNVDVLDWIEVGASEDNIPLAVGDFTSTKVRFKIPIGAPLCTARFRVNVMADGADYATTFFDISVKPK